MKTLYLTAAVTAAALSLVACGKNDNTPAGIGPQGSTVAKAMPDTAAQPADNALHTVPDAGATGTIPADNSTPPAAPTSNPGESATTPPTVPASR